jgi:hypothetical protein
MPEAHKPSWTTLHCITSFLYREGFVTISQRVNSDWTCNKWSTFRSNGTTGISCAVLGAEIELFTPCHFATQLEISNLSYHWLIIYQIVSHAPSVLCLLYTRYNPLSEWSGGWLTKLSRGTRALLDLPVVVLLVWHGCRQSSQLG